MCLLSKCHAEYRARLDVTQEGPWEVQMSPGHHCVTVWGLAL